MSRRNRVTPFSSIVSASARGTLTGNRGCLHDGQQNIRRHFQGTRWIVCLLEFKGRTRTLMTPGHYTELFFLDEATALTAGLDPAPNANVSGSRGFEISGASRILNWQERPTLPRPSWTWRCIRKERPRSTRAADRVRRLRTCRMVSSSPTTNNTRIWSGRGNSCAGARVAMSSPRPRSSIPRVY